MTQFALARSHALLNLPHNFTKSGKIYSGEQLWLSEIGLKRSATQLQLGNH